MAKKQKVGGSMCHNFVLVYLSNISFYVFHFLIFYRDPAGST